MSAPLLAATPLSAQNFIINGDFDQGIQGWTSDLAVTALVAPDLNGNPDSHSSKVVVNPSRGNSGTFWQCANIPTLLLQSVDFSADLYSLNVAAPSLRVFDQADCGGNDIGSLGNVNVSGQGSVNVTLDDALLPLGARSVRIAFPVDTAHVSSVIDHVQLLPAGQIFQSGFEETF